jgi:SAM-dependent methyltransferase
MHKPAGSVDESLDQRFGVDVDKSFDQRFSVDTFQGSMPTELSIQTASRKMGCSYLPTREDLFPRMMEHIHDDLRRYVFLDMGAGKGRCLLMAAEYPFKKIIGVEYSEALAAIARVNISTYSSQTVKCRDITCFCADASDFALPEQPLVIYLFNPFQGTVMDRVIKNIERSLEHQPRDVWIVYLTPWEHRKFRRSPKLHTVESNRGYCVYRSVMPANADGPIPS